MAGANSTGYCQCGCGERTKIATRTKNDRGDVRGKPMRFLLYHESRVRTVKPPEPKLCQCGCGERANSGRRFVAGHQGVPAEQRFWQKVAPITRATDCWIWTGGMVGNGYGKFEAEPHRPLRSHRYIWQQVYGTIPDGLNVLHRCDNPPCVNPHHMFLGTHAENVADKIIKGRHAKGATVGTSKLNDDIVRAIRADTASAKEIARKYGIHRLHVNVIKRRAAWKHVE